MSDNTIIIIGNLTRDPELRYTTGGIAVASFGLAQTERRKTESGGWEDGDTSFFNCVAWRELGENAAASFVKGQRIIVVGKLKQRTWETDQGEKRNAYEVVVDDLGGSIKWGTTSYEKTSRSGSGRSRPAANHQPDPIYGDEEPF